MSTAMITDEGNTALWVGFFGMFLPFLYFNIDMWSKPQGKRKFHVYTLMINGIASVAYLYMATGNGWKEVDGRQFFFVRYVDWLFTTPLLVLDLCLLGKASADTTNLLLGMDILMIVSGVTGAFLTGNATDGDYRPWVFFALGCFFFLPIVYELGFGIPYKMLQDPRTKTLRVSGVPETVRGCFCFAPASAYQRRSTFDMVAWLTIITWTLYPVVWVLAEGTHILSPNMEVISYTVMDLLSKSVFGIILISSHSLIEESLIEDGEFTEDEEQPLVGGGENMADMAAEAEAAAFEAAIAAMPWYLACYARCCGIPGM